MAQEPQPQERKLGSLDNRPERPSWLPVVPAPRPRIITSSPVVHTPRIPVGPPAPIQTQEMPPGTPQYPDNPANTERISLITPPDYPDPITTTAKMPVLPDLMRTRTAKMKAEIQFAARDPHSWVRRRVEDVRIARARKALAGIDSGEGASDTRERRPKRQTVLLTPEMDGESLVKHQLDAIHQKLGADKKTVEGFWNLTRSLSPNQASQRQFERQGGAQNTSVWDSKVPGLRIATLSLNEYNRVLTLDMPIPLPPNPETSPDVILRHAWVAVRDGIGTSKQIHLLLNYARGVPIQADLANL